MKRLLPFLLSGAILAFAADSDSPSGNRTTPSTIASVSPRGVARGMTVEISIEGFNLAKARKIFFSEPGVKGKILRVKELPDLPDTRLGANGTLSTVDLGPLPPRNQVTVELEVSPTANIGVVSFRLQNELGTTPEGKFLIEPFYGESADNEPNDTPENAVETFLPAILTGAISKPGDQDLYKIKVKAGDELVFSNGAMALGSTLQPVVAILSDEQTVLREYGYEGGRSVNAFSHKFKKGGTYYIRVADYEQSGKGSHFYRIVVGSFPFLTSAYPLGVQRGKNQKIEIHGNYLAANSVEVKGEPNTSDPDVIALRPKGATGLSFSEVKLRLGDEPEAESTGANTALASAQTVAVPVAINGRITADKKGQGTENYFRFSARKGQKVVLEVVARRLGSDLDSQLEVLDAKGNSIERAVARPVTETYTTLRDVDSAGRGIRIQSWSGVNVGDYMLIGSELLRVDALPKGPDDDIVFDNFQGQRISYYDTTSEAHNVDKSIYKVQLLPAGARPNTNGLPLMRLYYRNDDGGPGYGKDSLVHFTAPADGQYIVKLRDVRSLGGQDYAYRLVIREPKPDFRLAMNPRNPNVPQGGCIPLTVTASRMDDLDEPIEVSVDGLPSGFHATKGVIAPGQVSTTILLSAAADATGDAATLHVEGKATLNGRTIAHQASPEDSLQMVAAMPKPDITIVSETREVVLEPGKTAEVKVRIRRQNEFGGRIPVDVRNLPPRVHVLDVGLNGVLINETETERTFTLEALPSAEPVEQTIYVSGTIETRSPQQNSYAAEQGIRLRVKPKVQVSEVK